MRAVLCSVIQANARGKRVKTSIRKTDPGKGSWLTIRVATSRHESGGDHDPPSVKIDRLNTFFDHRKQLT